MTYPINTQNQRVQAYPGNYSGVTINVTNPSLSSNMPACPMQNPCYNQQAYQTAIPQAQIAQAPHPQVQQVNYPPEYYINNYNQPPQIIMQPQQQAVQPQQIGYVYPNQNSQNSYPANNGYINPVIMPQSQYQSPNYPVYPAYDFEQEQNSAASRDVLAKLDKLIELEQNQQKNKMKKQVTVLTDEYIMSLENFLNNPNKEIRRKGASEVINRLGEDKSRKNDPALNALLNKMLQDPDLGVRTLGISAFASGIAKGNDLSVQLLKYMEANPQLYPNDVEAVSMALLKMAADEETIYVDAPVKNK